MLFNWKDTLKCTLAAQIYFSNNSPILVARVPSLKSLSNRSHRSVQLNSLLSWAGHAFVFCKCVKTMLKYFRLFIISFFLLLFFLWQTYGINYTSQQFSLSEQIEHSFLWEREAAREEKVLWLFLAHILNETIRNVNRLHDVVRKAPNVDLYAVLTPPNLLTLYRNFAALIFFSLTKSGEGWVQCTLTYFNFSQFSFTDQASYSRNQIEEVMDAKGAKKSVSQI